MSCSCQRLQPLSLIHIFGGTSQLALGTRPAAFGQIQHALLGSLPHTTSAVQTRPGVGQTRRAEQQAQSPLDQVVEHHHDHQQAKERPQADVYKRQVLLSAAVLCRLRPLLARLRPALAGCLCCALVVLLTLSCTAVADYYDLGGPLPRSGEVNLYLRHALISLIMSALLLRYFYLQSQWRRQEQAELRARIESLQARIRPHFLFNSLNSIASLVTLCLLYTSLQSLAGQRSAQA